MLINTIEMIIITIEGHNRNNHQKAVHVLVLFFSLFSCDGGDGGDGGDSGDWKSQIHDDYPTAILPQYLPGFEMCVGQLVKRSALGSQQGLVVRAWLSVYPQILIASGRSVIYWPGLKAGHGIDCLYCRSRVGGA